MSATYWTPGKYHCKYCGLDSDTPIYCCEDCYNDFEGDYDDDFEDESEDWEDYIDPSDYEDEEQR